jgi:hypothetical protein
MKILAKKTLVDGPDKILKLELRKKNNVRKEILATVERNGEAFEAAFVLKVKPEQINEYSTHETKKALTRKDLAVLKCTATQKKEDIDSLLREKLQLDDINEILYKVENKVRVPIYQKDGKKKGILK